jgi:hypothetical protein
MRFKSYPRSPFTDTARKRGHLRRKQAAEREALPLFSAQIAAAQPGEDEVMHRRAIAWNRSQQEDRDRRAGNWRRARRAIAVRPARERALIRRAWDRAPFPADPSYLLDFLTQIDRGRVDLADALYASRTDPSGRRYDWLTMRADQLDRLRAFADKHGPAWRDAIADLWDRNREPAWLTSLRVSHGRHWLALVSLEDGRVHV